MKVLYACTPYTQQKFENLARNTSTITYKEFVVVFSAMDSLLNYYELRTYSVHYTQHQKKVTPIFLRSCDYDNQAKFQRFCGTLVIREFTIERNSFKCKKDIFF